MTDSAGNEQLPVSEVEPRQEVRVLAAEDEMPLRVLSKKFFGPKPLGLGLFDRYDVFENGREALEAFTQGDVAYNVAMLDYNMPGMNGAVLARELRRIKPDLLIVLVSSHTKSTLPPDESELFDLCLPKPFDGDAAESLANDIKAAITGAQAQ